MLYTVIAEHLETFLASFHDDPDGSGLPAYVEHELVVFQTWRWRFYGFDLQGVIFIYIHV